jgi:trans-2,3-dihydro-3-hydroxyanthranilate isomerase
MELTVKVVHACRRDGHGGSPTAVLDDLPLTETQRREVPVKAGTSHAVFISPNSDGASLRFFTAAGELPACGHGTVAALAVLARRSGAPRYEAVLRSGGRAYRGRATGSGDRYEASFDPGPVDLRTPAPEDSRAILAALSLGPAPCQIASVGRPRMLVQVPDRSVLTSLAPDLARVEQACDRLGLLGCYVYSPPTPDGRAAARMFAPSIGVPEDIANANSTACLAAHLAGDGFSALAVDMGDSLGEPATVLATTRPGSAGPLVEVGGTAMIAAGAAFR